MRRGMWVLKCIVFVVLMAAVAGFVTMSLWNWLVPVLFAGPGITFLQALGLLALSKIFLWTFGRRNHGYGGPWKHYWKQRWNKMTPEEREALKQKMKDRWCRYESGGPARQ